VRTADQALFQTLFRAALPEGHQPVRFRIRQRLEQHAIDDAEDRRVRPDAEREREHGHGGEAGDFQQLTNGVAKVVHTSVSQQAQNAVLANNSETPVNVSGSVGFTSWSKPLITRISANAPKLPIRMPTEASLMPCPITSESTFLCCAPSAMRTPISCVR